MGNSAQALQDQLYTVARQQGKSIAFADLPDGSGFTFQTSPGNGPVTVTAQEIALPDYGQLVQDKLSQA